MTPPRIYCIPARDAPIVAVFRRGPSAWSHIGRWDLAEGRYEPGAWLRGRVFPRRSDVSPDGRHLCYFAHDPRATWEHGDAYVAVSRLPWLTALHAFGTCGTHTRGYHFAPRGAEPEGGAAERGEGDLRGAGERGEVDLRGTEPGEGDLRGAEGGEGDLALPIRWTLAPTPIAQFATERRLGWEEAPDSPPRVPRDAWDARRNARLRRARPGDHERAQALRVESLGTAGGEFGTGQAIDGMRVEYALETDEAVEGLPDAQWADWDARGRLLVATRDGRLQVREPDGGAVLQEHDLAGLSPDPAPAPAWAGEW